MISHMTTQCPVLTSAAFGVVFAVLWSPLGAQDFVVVEEPAREPTVEVEVQKPRPTIEGIVTEIFTTRPWQAVNPLAPQSAGTGEQFVSRNFGPGTPYHNTTVTVIGVEW